MDGPQESTDELQESKDELMEIFGQSTDDLVYKSTQVLVQWVALKNDDGRRIYAQGLETTDHPEDYPLPGFSNIVFILCRQFCSVALRTMIPYSKHQQNVIPETIVSDFNKFWKLLNIDDSTGEVTPVINVLRSLLYTEQSKSSGSKEAAEKIIQKLTTFSNSLMHIEILNSSLLKIKHQNFSPPPLYDELVKKGFNLNIPAIEVFGATLRTI